MRMAVVDHKDYSKKIQKSLFENSFSLFPRSIIFQTKSEKK